MFAYLAKPDSHANLRQELRGHMVAEHGTLLLADANINAAFAIDRWPTVQLVHIASIGDAVKLLKTAGKYWYHYPVTQVRRGTLIQQQLRKLPVLKPLVFPPAAKPTIGIFSLLDQNTLLYCPHPERWMPAGAFYFQEDKVNPPNRAYLKLWEALSLSETCPQPGNVCLDLGASPGGWSWVLQQLGAQVIAVDKAPLDPNIQKLPNIKWLSQSAFALDPQQFERVDWLVCDIICYPQRTLSLVQQWIASGKVRHMICTIKLQGTVDFAVIRAFQAIPNAEVLQLWHNKHELTFFWSA